MKKDLISVILPAHNEEDVISKAINSVLNSTYKNYEIVVVNNGSTDRTREIVEKFVTKNHCKIRLINFDPIVNKQQEKMRGAAFSRNRGVEVARGDIVFFLDADDWLRNDTLENVAKSFEKHKNVNFIIRNRKVKIPKNWRRIFIYNFISLKDRIDLVKEDEPEGVTQESDYCICAAKTKSFREVGSFDEKYFYREDLELGSRLKKLKIPKLLSQKIIYFTEMGTTLKDFKRLCKNVAVSRSIGLSDKYSFSKILYQTALFIIIFPFFYLSLFAYSVIKSGDLLVSITIPFLMIMKRILMIYYFIKLKTSS
jgi:glycosyltransferase involved in cell wall biosynthesis